MRRKTSYKAVRLRAALTIGAAVALAAVPNAAPAAVAHHGAAVPAAHSTEPKLLDLLAGSPSYLVYVEAGLLPAGGHVAVPTVSKPLTHLFARTRGGRMSDLGSAPRGLQSKMSISRNMLTGITEDSQVYTPYPAAHWWRLGTHRHGRFALPAGARYLSAAPDGAVLAKGGKLLEVTTTGTVRHWGTPIPDAAYLAAVSDDHGVVVLGWASGSHMPTTLAYMRFANPGHFVPLDYSTTDALRCTDVDKLVVGCHTENDDGGVLGTQLIPLDGTAATTTTHGGWTLGLIGRTAIWDDERGPIHSITLGDATVRQGPASLTPERYNRTVNGTEPYPDIRGFGPSLVAALGKVAILQDHDRRVTLVSSVSHGEHLFSRDRSPAAVSAFGLTGDRAVYAGDRKVPHHSGRFSTYTVAIRHGSGRATFGTPRLLHADSDYALAGTSRQVQVYAVRDAQEHSDLKVVYRGKTHTIDRVAWDSYLSVAGTRVMYAPQYLPAGGPTAVYDAATGITVQVDTDAACCDHLQGRFGGRTPALMGPRVFFIKTDGSVWQHDVVTGKESQLAAPRVHILGGLVFAAGGRVAWTLTRGVNHPTAHSYVRTIGAVGGTRFVPGRVLGVSAAGVLTTDSTLDYRNAHMGPTAAYTWRPFNGAERLALSKREVFVPPKLAGHTMAWVDTAGRLRVKDL